MTRQITNIVCESRPNEDGWMSMRVTINNVHPQQLDRLADQIIAAVRETLSQDDELVASRDLNQKLS